MVGGVYQKPEFIYDYGNFRREFAEGTSVLKGCWVEVRAEERVLASYFEVLLDELLVGEEFEEGALVLDFFCSFLETGEVQHAFWD